MSVSIRTLGVQVLGRERRLDVLRGNPPPRSHGRGLRRTTADLQPVIFKWPVTSCCSGAATWPHALIVRPRGRDRVGRPQLVHRDRTRADRRPEAGMGQRLARVRARAASPARCRPSVVGLEILEDELLDERFVHALIELKRQGYRLALDDFQYTRQRRAAARPRRRRQARPARAGTRAPRAREVARLKPYGVRPARREGRDARGLTPGASSSAATCSRASSSASPSCAQPRDRRQPCVDARGGRRAPGPDRAARAARAR